MKSPRKSPRNLNPNTVRLSPKTSDHVRASEKSKEAITEMNTDARKSALEKKKIRAGVSCLLRSSIMNAPSADEHRHERAGIDALVAELLEEKTEMHFNFERYGDSP